MIGVIANFCGSNYHGKLVKDALPDDLPLWAALKSDEAVELPERHLGLVQPFEQGEVVMEQRLEAGADMLEEAGILSYIEKLKPIHFPPQKINRPPNEALKGATIAIARDEAFSFAYAANISLLKAMGGSIVYFSPIHNDCIPSEATAIWLPGGYPEIHAKKLAENTSMLTSLRSFHQQGKPILAECGGFLYCMDSLVDLEGKSFAMAGVLPGVGTMKNKAG